MAIQTDLLGLCVRHVDRENLLMREDLEILDPWKLRECCC